LDGGETITGSKALGERVTGNERVGGFVGFGILSVVDNIQTFLINKCSSVADVYAAVDGGGFIGKMNAGKISSSNAKGDVFVSTRGGGFLGKAEFLIAGTDLNLDSLHIVIIDSYSHGDVKRAEGGRVSESGGFAGSVLTTNPILVGPEVQIINCYSAGTIFGDSSSGAFAGTFDIDSAADDNYYDSDKAGLANACGAGYCGNFLTDQITGKTTQEMKLKETFSGWDFVYIWGITEPSYPYLMWQDTSNLPRENNDQIRFSPKTFWEKFVE